MKVLFLDIDGVLNSKTFFEEDKAPHSWNETQEIDSKAVEILNTILNRVEDCYIVVSSTWRLNSNVSRLKEILFGLGENVNRIIDLTPVLACSYERGHEISKWLSENEKVKSFVILDDDNDMGELLPFLVQTEWKIGLTSELADKAVKLLQGETGHAG